MIRAAPANTDRQSPTVWGLSPTDLHDRFWAARGVQVVRRGDTAEIMPDAELFLLTDARSLTIFRLGQLVDTLNWLKPRVMFVRLRSVREHGYRERIITDAQERFQRFERVYHSAEFGVTRVALTPEPDLARQWRDWMGPPTQAWRNLRSSVSRDRRTTVSVEGSIYNRSYDPEVMRFIRGLVQAWHRPGTTIVRARHLDQSVWSDVETQANPNTRFIGPVWLGTGRRLDDVESVVGPAVLWDDPDARPEAQGVPWQELEPSPQSLLPHPIRVRPLNRFHRAGKRVFDIAFASIALLATLPIYPWVFLAIWLDDGRPFFFAHRRETMGGREFGCLKFRTMKHNAEELKNELKMKNQADGPQFFMDNDPRLTRVGNILRKTNIDELPQFLNVFTGDMSVVGPRPSPHSENQYCPPWREARLSVRPGITGLWQVMRSRQQGLDFQEWIRYDIEYVENVRWKTDLWIICRTVSKLLGR